MGVNKYDHIGKESSRVEYMAQKQNRIYQRLLDDKIHNIDKDFTLAKLGHRMFVKQLKYDMAQLKRSTGHSPFARPPSGEEDTRRNAWKLPRLKKSDLEPQRTLIQPSDVSLDDAVTTQSQNQTLTTISENTQPQDVTRSEPAFFLTQQTTVVEPPHKSIDPLKLDEINQEHPETDEAPAAPTISDDTLNLSHNSTASKTISARIAEAQRIINMPTVYQTTQLTSRRVARNRVLPPIAVVTASMKTEREGTECKGEEEEGNPAEKTNGIRVHFTPPELSAQKTEKPQKKQEINELLQESLKRAAEQRRQEQRTKRRLNARKKLAIERPEGLFRPDNVKLIHTTFKKEELYNQHKQLLEENLSRKNIPLPALSGSNKLQGKLQAFYDKAVINGAVPSSV